MISSHSAANRVGTYQHLHHLLSAGQPGQSSGIAFFVMVQTSDYRATLCFHLLDSWECFSNPSTIIDANLATIVFYLCYICQDLFIENTPSTNINPCVLCIIECPPGLLRKLEFIILDKCAFGHFSETICSRVCGPLLRDTLNRGRSRMTSVR